MTAHEMGQLDAALRWLRPRMAVCVVEHNMGFMEDGRIVADVGHAALAGDPGLFDRYLGVGRAA